MKAKDVKEQYAKTGNLQARKRLHNKYSTNSYGWGRWVFDQYVFPEGCRILELGCGTGSQWGGKYEVLEKNWQLTLTDFSQAMVDRTIKFTKPISENITYKQVNAENIPFDDNSFDAIIANHMIYHIQDKDKALSEMIRVLKPGGKLYATTLGIHNMVELGQLLSDFDKRIDFQQHHVASSFGLENGGEILRKFFKQVDVRRYIDSLNIKEPDPLFDYVLSLKGFGNVVKIIEERGKDEFEAYIYGLFYEDENVSITKDGGMFVATK